MPQLLLAMMRAVGCWICCTATSRSEAPTPQFAPIATGCTGEFGENTPARSAGARPIIVRPAVSNEPVTVYGRPTSIAARAAARISSGADFVSIQATSTPPAMSPSTCSRNASKASSSEILPSGLEQLAGRADRSGDEHGSVGGRGDGTGQLGGLLGDLGGAVAVAVQVQPVAVAAERVGEDDVGAGVDERLVQFGHLVRLLEVPELGRLARPEAHPEVVGAGGAVGQQGAIEGEEGVERCPHGDAQASGRNRPPLPTCQPGCSPLGNGDQAMEDLADEPAGGPVVDGAGDVAGSGRRARHVGRVGVDGGWPRRDEPGAPAREQIGRDEDVRGARPRRRRRSGRGDAAVERRALDVIDADVVADGSRAPRHAAVDAEVAGGGLAGGEGEAGGARRAVDLGGGAAGQRDRRPGGSRVRSSGGCATVGYPWEPRPSFAIIRQRVPDGQSIASIWSTVPGTVISVQLVPPFEVASSTPSKLLAFADVATGEAPQ